METSTRNRISRVLHGALQTQHLTFTVITFFQTGKNIYVQKSGAEPNVLGVGAASTMTPPSSLDLLPYASRSQVWTINFESRELCLDKRHHTTDCPLIPREENYKFTLEGRISMVCSHRKPQHTINVLQIILEQGVITANRIVAHVPSRKQSSRQQANDKTSAL